jgi:1-acyl-sn-glycerol-3-phosphate acyltransferase
MKLLIRLLKLIFSLYGLLVFIASFFIVFPLYYLVFNFFRKETASVVAHTVSRAWGEFLLLAFFIKVRVRNRSLIDPQKTYVFISNHQSQLDIIIAAVSCRNTFRFLAKAELTKVPVIGYVIKRLYVPVERKSKTGRSKSIDALRKSIGEGISVFLYPEGTRNKTDAPLLDFYDGAFRLAIETQVPLAILTIKNSRRLLDPRRVMDLSPGVIECIWHEPVPTAGMTTENVGELKERAKSILMGGLEKNP